MLDLPVAELRKASLLPNIQDEATNDMLSLTHGSMSYAVYTQHLNDFLRRSRQQLTADVQCVRFINGLANFELKTHAKSHRSHKGYDIKLVEKQNFLNDVVNDSPHLGGRKSTTEPSASPGGGQPTRKHTHKDPLLGASKIGSVITVLVVAVDVEEVKVVVADLCKALAELILALLLTR
jgi:hypothetical protein